MAASTVAPEDRPWRLRRRADGATSVDDPTTSLRTRADAVRKELYRLRVGGRARPLRRD